MNRREFSVAAPALTLMSAAVSPWAQAQTFKPAEGTDYYVLGKPVAVEAPVGKIEVVEFFWYRCGHCNSFEPALEAWSKKLPKDVVLRRVPVAFQDSFAPLQRLFYTLEAMGLSAKLHAKVFNAIHVERVNLEKGDSIIEWVTQQGVDKLKFVEQFNSFSINSKATKAAQLQNGYRVEGVPALGVAGRFYTDGSLARSMDRALQVVDALILDVRAKR